MKIGSLDNQVILYMEGNEDLDSLIRFLDRASPIKGVPLHDLSAELTDSNGFPTIGHFHDETDSDEQLVGDGDLNDYREFVAKLHREYIIGEKQRGDMEYGKKEHREYAAKEVAFRKVGSPKGVDWAKPGSIEIPDDIKKEYGLK